MDVGPSHVQCRPSRLVAHLHGQAHDVVEGLGGRVLPPEGGVLASAPASFGCRNATSGLACASRTTIFSNNSADPAGLDDELYIVAADSQLNFHVLLNPKETAWVEERERRISECYRDVSSRQKFLNIEIQILDSTSRSTFTYVCTHHRPTAI